MGENLVKTKDVLAVWENLQDVRAQFAPTLTEKEFSFFVTLGKSFGANPFLREIWAVKYDSKSPASIFLGRDMYRRRAQEIPEYNGHTVQAIYEKDKFEFDIVNEMPKHSYSNFGDRGKLLGAYYIGWSKRSEHPFYVSVRFDEYNNGFALWKTKPETQIKKVAEAQGLRGQYQGYFAGTYDESEQWAVENKGSAKGNIPDPPLLKKQENLNSEDIITVTATEEPIVSQNQGNPTPIVSQNQGNPTPIVSQNQGNPAHDQEPPADFKLAGEEDDNSLDGLKSKIRKLAAQAFPNENSFALWLKTATTSEDGKYNGYNTLSFCKSIGSAKVIYGKLQKLVEEKKKRGE
jgi:phage recombination protein Bet